MSAEVASPKATGGGGVAFEFKVQAALLATMLANGRYPCLPAGKAESIRLQARQAGYHTDDILVSFVTQNGTEHKLLVQAKSSCAFTEGDADFKSALTGAWDDFMNTELFDCQKDMLLLATGPGSAKAISHFRPLLTRSQTSATHEEYFEKIAAGKFTSDTTRTYLKTIQTILEEHTGTKPEDAQIWSFLNCFRWVMYDFDCEGSHDRACVCGMLDLGLEEEPPKSSDSIWSELITLAVDYNPDAGTISRQQLAERFPGCMRDSVVTVSPGVARLSEHADNILSIVQTQLRDGSHINRQWLIDHLWYWLMQRKCLLVFGVAGVGKSAVVKDLISVYAKNIPTFMLKADELDRPHLHEALTEIGVSESIETLSQRFGMLKPKLLVVEALEKLLEADSHDAFHQLLKLVLNDDSWLVIMTCRSHALGDIKGELLLPQRCSPVCIEMPLLADWELKNIADQHAGLQPLLDNVSVKDLLRVPMYLSYATTLDWSLQEGANTVDIQEFKTRLWRNIVRKDTDRRDGINLRRETCFTQVAVQRAKAMRPFIPTDSFDAAALNALETDSIIIRTEDGIAPAHDLFEDWAVERSIEATYSTCNQDHLLFLSTIGTEPAMRRGFRSWLTNKLKFDDGAISNFVACISDDDSLLPFWRDEVLVATLLSPQAGRFFASQPDALLDNGLALMIRVIHLLRTACKEPDISKISQLPVNAKGMDFFSSMFLRPVGSGWEAAIVFLEENIRFIQPTQSPVILGLLQDWLSVLDEAKGLPAAARSSGLIALHLLELTRGEYDDDYRKEILHVAYRVADSIRAELETLFGETLAIPTYDEEDSHTGIFGGEARKSSVDHRFHNCITDAAIASLHCSWLCKVMPESVDALARRKWIPKRKPGEVYHHEFGVDIGHYFGLDRDYGFELHPASALQGPFYFLLKASSDSGLSLILDLINTTTELYARSDLDSPQDEDLPKVAIRLNDGREISQYTSWRLWAGYRGNTVLPNVLQSALMALEKWLLEQAETEQDIGEIYDRLIEDSASCAISGVLASVATRFPQRVLDHMYPLLRAKDFFELDMSRALTEAQIIVDMGAAMGMPERAENGLYIDERKEAQSSEHRKHYLETLVLNLQFTDLCSDVQKIIDEHHSKLPTPGLQTDNDRTWRLALHRMDLRKCKFEKAEGDKVLVTSSDPDPDIQNMQARALPDIEYRQKLGHVGMWGRCEFQTPGKSPSPFESWKEAIQWAKDTLSELQSNPDKEENRIWTSGPIHIAALSIRDHINEMEETDLLWCAQRILHQVMLGLHIDPQVAALHSSAFSGAAACALVLPLLLGHVKEDPSEDDVLYAIAGSLTHPDQNVQGSAIQGVRQHLWANHTELAHSCLAGMIEYGRLEKQENDDIREIHKDFHDPNYKEKEASVRQRFDKLRSDLRSDMASEKLAGTIDPSAIALDDWSAYSLSPIVQMLPEKKELYDWEPLLLTIIDAVLVAEEEDGTRKRDWGTTLFGLKRTLADCTAYFAMKHDAETSQRICAPFAKHIDQCPDYTGDFVEQLIINAENSSDPRHFWNVWHMFADPVLDPQRLTSRQLWVHDEKLIRALLLGTIPWKSDLHEWRFLSEAPEHMADACVKACNTSAGFEATMGLLYSVGGFYLPAAFGWLAKALPTIDCAKLFSDKNNKFLLESLLQREVHMHSAEIRKDAEFHRHVIALLDVLVNAGSSAAFQLRERIIRPARL